MSDDNTPWTPRIGQRVRVKASGQLGMIEDIEGIGVYERFILKFDPSRAGAQALPGRHKPYQLAELEPSR